MNDITVHGIAGSPYTRSVILALEEKGVPYTFDNKVGGTPISPHKSPEHLARHPFGRIPILRHGDFWLYETQAILRYLDSSLPGPALRPENAQAAARADQIMGIVDWYFFPQVGTTLLFQRVLVPWRGGMPDEALCAATVPQAERALTALEDLVSGDGPYLVSAEVTCADLLLISHLMFAMRAPETTAIISRLPKLTAWLGLMRQRASVARTEDVYGPPLPAAAVA